MRNNLPFEISKQDFFNTSLYRIQNTQNGEFFDVIPDCGGIINNITFNFNGEHLSVIDGYSSVKQWEETVMSSFKGSKLFPYPNRLKNGQYNYNKKDFKFDINLPSENQSIHGLMLKQKFEVESFECNSNEAEIRLSYTSSGKEPGYPYKYKLILTYCININSEVLFKTKIISLDNKTMPVGDGWHHYFSLGTKIDNLEFMLQSSSKFLIDDQKIPTLKQEAFSEFSSKKPLGSINLDDCFSCVDYPNVPVALIEDTKNNRALELYFNNEHQSYKNMQIYTPEHRNSIAIEPMTCIPDSFNNKQDLLKLKAKQIIQLTWMLKKKEVK